MLRPAHVLGIAIACAFACSRGTVLRFELDPPSGARTAVVALQYRGAQGVTALDIDRRQSANDLPFIDDFSGNAHVVVLWYARTLAELQLPEGRLAPTTIKGFRRRLPLNPQQIDEADVSGDHLASWTHPQTINELLSQFRYKSDTNLCVELEGKNVELAGSSADLTTATAAIDDSSVLVTNRFGPLYRVDRAGAVSFPAIPDFKPTSAFHGPDGRIWLGGEDGSVRVGSIEAGFEPVGPPSPQGIMLRWIDGSHDLNAPFELFTMTDRGHFSRFDRSSWELLRTAPPSEGTPVGGVVWLGPGEAVAIPPQPPSIQYLIYRTKRSGDVTEVTEIRVPGNLGQPTALTYAPGIGVVYATRSSRIFVLEGSDIHRLEGEPSFDFPRAIAPFRGGFIFAGVGVSLAQYVPGVDYCDEFAIPTSVTPLVFTPLGDGLVLSGVAPLMRPSAVLMLTPRAPAR